MTERGKLMVARVGLFILTMGGILTLFQVLFDTWMTAYPFVNISEWRTRLLLRLATIVGISIIWSTILAWLLRHRKGA